MNTVIDNGGLGWNPFRLFWFPKKNRILKEAILSFQPDIVHFHSVIPYLGLSILALPRRYGVPVVQTLHNGRWLCVEGGFYREGHYCDDCIAAFGWKGVINGCGRGRFPALVLFVVNFIARSSGQLFNWIDCFIPVSEFVRVQYVNSGFPARQMEVNNNGIDIDSLDRAGYAKLWKDRSGVAFAGRISVAKGVEVIKYLVLHIEQPFHIIGDGSELPEFVS